MKTISDYTIYCTEEQTKKAIALSVPIVYKYLNPRGISCLVNDYKFSIPTAEEMIGWLEDQGILLELDTISTEDERNCLIIKWEYFLRNKQNDIINSIYNSYSSRKEATLAGISAALEYLANK